MRLSISFSDLQIRKLLRKPIIASAVSVCRVLLSIITVILIAILIRNVIHNALSLRQNTRALNQVSLDLEAKMDPAQISPKSRDFSIISRSPILGPLTDPKATTTAATDDKPKSKLELTLIGTFIQGQKNPYAIIEDKKKNNQDIFRVDEMIFNEARLKKVLNDRVEIERGGQIEVLMFDESEQTEKPAVDADTTEFVIEESELDRALENLPTLLTQARSVPFFKDGVAIGIRLFAIKSGSLYEKLGLRNGDVLKSVNGNSLGDFSQAMKIFETLKSERSLSVKLLRNLEEKEFRYEIN